MSLKIIHTADWHLGQTFFGYDRDEEHEAFLSWLIDILTLRQTDVLLIAGDVFDVANPSAAAQRRFFRFLREANRHNPQLQIVIIAGNHDSAARLEAPIPLLEELNTSIVGVVPRTDLCKIDFDSLLIPLYNKEGNGKRSVWLFPIFVREIIPLRKKGKIPMWRALPECIASSMTMPTAKGNRARPCLRWDTCMRLVLNCRKMTGANGPSWEDLNLYR